MRLHPIPRSPSSFRRRQSAVSGAMRRAPGWCLPRPTVSGGRVLICGRPCDSTTVAYGRLPYALFEDIRQKFIATVRAARGGAVPRSE
jgi:hypothetical protein